MSVCDAVSCVSTCYVHVSFVWSGKPGLACRKVSRTEDFCKIRHAFVVMLATLWWVLFIVQWAICALTELAVHFSCKFATYWMRCAGELWYSGRKQKKSAVSEASPLVSCVPNFLTGQWPCSNCKIVCVLLRRAFYIAIEIHFRNSCVWRFPIQFHKFWKANNRFKNTELLAPIGTADQNM